MSSSLIKTSAHNTSRHPETSPAALVRELPCLFQRNALIINQHEKPVFKMTGKAKRCVGVTTHKETIQLLSIKVHCSKILWMQWLNCCFRLVFVFAQVTGRTWWSSCRWLVRRPASPTWRRNSSLPWPKQTAWLNWKNLSMDLTTLTSSKLVQPLSRNV